MTEKISAKAQADIEAQAKMGYALKKKEVVHDGLSLVYSKDTDEGEDLKMTYIFEGQMMSKQQLFFVLDCGYEKVRVKTA